MVRQLCSRYHLFEIDDQPWFPSVLRSRVQAALTQAWLFSLPVLCPTSAADHTAIILLNHLGPDLTSLYTFVDFCAGGGGPTPRIERVVNAHAAKQGLPRADFVMTDIHPNVREWSEHSKECKEGTLRYVGESVDASKVDGTVMEKLVSGATVATASASGVEVAGRAGTSVRLGPEDRGSKGVFRLFNLAFHHFDDPLAKGIMRNCVDTNTPFAIFELQDRTVESLISVVFFGCALFLMAPYWAWVWGSWESIFFVYVIPILPAVLVFDGVVSSLRTRSPQEIAVMLKSCGGEDAHKWKVSSGRVRFLGPFGYLSYVICEP